MPVFDEQRRVPHHDDASRNSEDGQNEEVENEDRQRHDGRLADADDAEQREESEDPYGRPGDVELTPQIVGVVHPFACTDDCRRNVRKEREASGTRGDPLVGRVQKDGVGPAIERQRASDFCVDLPI